MWAENSAVKETDYDHWYSANFEGLKARIQPVANAVRSALAPVEGAAMCGYLSIADGVVQVNYDNGAAIVVNYTGKPVQTGLGSVDAYGWINGTWR